MRHWNRPSFDKELTVLIFMKTIKIEKLILIGSGSLANQVLKNIHSYKLLSPGFVCCQNRDHYTNLLTKYNKIIEIYNDRNSLIESKNISLL